MSGITDEPLSYRSSDKDTLGVDRYSQVLAEFVEQTNTPMSIGIQGEWGSGKTSLLNSIWGRLADRNSSLLIWINAWEYSLLTLPEEALLKIIVAITSEIQASDTNQSNADKVIRATKGLLTRVARFGAAASLSAMGVGEKSDHLVDELLEKKESSVSDLRNALQDVVNSICSKNNSSYKRVVIFVDDLDRLDPTYAVQLLELLKNIFGLSNCVFLLAIDYQVVVKGLRHKFGEMNKTNEWEFRAFFDKLIQLPFMMPVGEYAIGQYINSLLTKINYDISKELDKNKIAYEEIILCTIGSNPRAIKRLVNSLLLIEMMNKNNSFINNYKMLMLAIVCLQIAFPSFYQLLQKTPDFTLFDENFAFFITKGEEKNDPLFDFSYERACEHELFIADWEKSLYRIAYINSYNRSRVFDISKFFNLILKNIQDNNLDIGETITALVDRSVITTVTAAHSHQSKGSINKIRLDGWASYALSQQERGIPSEIIEILQILHDGVLENFVGEPIYVNYTPSVFSFNVDTNKRKKCFLYAIPYKKKVEVHCNNEKFFITEKQQTNEVLSEKVRLSFSEILHQ
ncbi:MAG: hypothetical protein E6Q83_04430 [Thiothrix sp.]|nr:MAG: hypothetical protein E6Q83_04430 [Thiothrix sp.]